MARIRTIKPEFPQSESVGRLSRDARLCFIMLWTIADDSGRLRGNSRMLASLLYPYDDDAKGLMDGWLAELEAEKCVTRYTVEGDTFVQIRNWLTHQKIDKPSPSKLPAFDDASRTFAKPREDSSADLDLEGIKEGIKDRDQRAREPEEVPRGTFAKIRDCYPPGLYGDNDWLLAEREIRGRLAGDASLADLVSAAAAYGMQQEAIGKVGTQYIQAPSKFFAKTGKWRGPFPTPAKPENAYDRLMRLNGGTPDTRIIEHEPDSAGPDFLALA